jgi:beta-galactosidase
MGDATLKPAKLSCISPYIDIIGCNYADSSEYTTVRSLYPDMPIMGTEAYSSLHTRGIYMNNDASCFCTELDERKVSWGDYFWEVCDMWYGSNANAGAFMWTGFDYLGEPTPFADSKYYPAKSSQFGVFDQAGFPKDAAHMFKSIWSGEPTVHIGITDWDSWTEGEQHAVRVYSNQPSVELFLNGASLGVASTKSSMHAFEYSVTYASGVLSCIAYSADGNVAAAESLSTSSKAVSKLELAPDSDVVDTDEGFSFVACQLLDSNGVPVPTACDEVQFEVSGGTCYGTENGRP